MTREEHARIARAVIASGKSRAGTIRFTVPGNPIPWARQRIARNGHHFTDARTKRAKLTVEIAARSAMHGDPSLLWPVRVTLRFFRETRQRCDLDRLASLPLDAMNEIVYHDDLQVVELHASKAVDKDNPRTEIIVEPV